MLRMFIPSQSADVDAILEKITNTSDPRQYMQMLQYASDMVKMSVLEGCCEKGNYTAVHNILTFRNLRFNLTVSGNTLAIALASERIDIIRALLDAGASVLPCHQNLIQDKMNEAIDNDLEKLSHLQNIAMLLVSSKRLSNC